MFCQVVKSAQSHTACLILAMLILTLCTRIHAETTEPDCAAQLDAAVALAGNPDNELSALDRRFAELESRCPAFAQLAHNRGVVAGMDDRWSQAIQHFERALTKDKRAADTHRQLRQIYEYRAAQAYAKVLESPLQAEPPALGFQDSTLHNSDIHQSYPEHGQLRDIATIEYELFEWWQARKNWTGIRQYYVEGFDIEAIKLAREEYSSTAWQDMKREIAFTENDVVVIISDSSESQTLLLLRLNGSRWQIYQETRL